jgi:hypothetical protein
MAPSDNIVRGSAAIPMRKFQGGGTMKLFLTWLLGVPLLVISMVMAQSLLMQAEQLEVRTRIGVLCSGQGDADDVAPLVPNQGYRISCDRLAVH